MRTCSAILKLPKIAGFYTVLEDCGLFKMYTFVEFVIIQNTGCQCLVWVILFKYKSFKQLDTNFFQWAIDGSTGYTRRL